LEDNNAYLIQNTFESFTGGLPQIKTDELEHLYITLKKPVFLLALSIVGDYSLAEDIMHDTFIKVCENYSSFKFGLSRKAWIMTIAHNLGINCLKKRNHETLSGDEIISQIDSIHYTEADSSIEFIQALSELEELDRSIVVLHACCGLQHHRIASIVGLTAGNTRARYTRALKKLKIYYEKNNKG
jgi:RNA polymerase sigma-70 factor (ECF subfamily)